jgi:hypothetical protein
MMNKQTEDTLVEVFKEIRNWVRAAAYGPVKALLEAELPDAKARAAYQMLDGTVSMDQVRVACKMSPNGLLALANRWAAAGLMEVNAEKKRVRLFNLADFGLIGNDEKERARRE